MRALAFLKRALRRCNIWHLRAHRNVKRADQSAEMAYLSRCQCRASAGHVCVLAESKGRAIRTDDGYHDSPVPSVWPEATDRQHRLGLVGNIWQPACAVLGQYDYMHTAARQCTCITSTM